jgi:phosphoglucosamine mutase
VRHLFGTDGIRAPFGTFPLDRATVTGLGRHLAQSLRETTGESRPEVVLGGDTRESTPVICAWLANGLAAGGADSRWVGVLPTAGIAYLVRGLGTAAGVAVSASHNPYPDNGIKLIDPWGFKWSEAAEAALETRLLAGGPEGPAAVETGEGDDGGAFDLGGHEEALVEHYVEALASTLPGRRPLAGLRLAVDAGNGAASTFAEPLFRRLGAGVRVIHASPDGRNVNLACGSTDTGDLAREVVTGGHHLGVAFDGDADRVILVDEGGLERDGDAILYLWARELAETGSLEPPRIVATSMSNLGLERALAEHGIVVERCGVGDREVVDTLRRESLLLGGEQSGHVVHLGLSTTGDGLLTALQMAFLVARQVRGGAAERPLSGLLAGFRRFPQVLVNVRVREKPDLLGLAEVAAAAREAEERLGADGRLVLRYSGTEPLARVMIEGPDQEEIEALAGRIAETIRDAIGAETGAETPAAAEVGR